MTDFKVGDKIRLIESFSSSIVATNHGNSILKKGDVAVVAHPPSPNIIGPVISVRLSCGAIARGLRASRFEKVNDMDHLYNNEKPFGLLSKEEQKYLRENQNSSEYFCSAGKWQDKVGSYFSLSNSYRLKKPPERVSITSLNGTVEMKDGKPDWSTYEE